VNGNVNSATATVTVVDAIIPTVATNDVTIYLDANGQASISVAMIDNNSFDNCGIAGLVLDNMSFDCSNVGANTVTLTATDVNGNVNSATATVTVVDAIIPTVATNDVTIYLDANGQASISVAMIDNNSFDNCGIASLVLDNMNFDCANVGANTVTLTATDVNGNVNSATATVTVVDAIIPTVATNDVTIYLDANGQASISVAMIDNNSFDNCGIAGLVLDNMSFDCSNVGANTVTLTATDVNGNVNSATATVTVVDAIIPTVATNDVTIYLDANGQASISVAMIDNNSFDNCGIAGLVLDNMTFDCSNVGANTVTLTATDVNGNVNSATATVTVVDAIIPTVVTNDVTIYLDANGQASISVSMIDNNSFDNCGIAGLVLDNMSFDCSNVGVNTVTLTATDVNGNVNSATATVTIFDNIAPTALCQTITVTLANGQAFITAQDIDAGSYDNCGVQSLSVSKDAFDCGDIGSNLVTLTVTDVNGNVSTCQTNVEVIGEIPTCSIDVALSNNTYTGGDGYTIFLGYGPQSLTATVTALGGGPFTYSWTGGNGWLSSTTSANPVFSPLAGGNYTLECTVTNSYGCQTTCYVNICVMDIRAGGSGKNQKVYLCHVPNGNPNKAKTLKVSVNAVPGHLLNHAGDRLGQCNQSCSNPIVRMGIDVDDVDDHDHDHGHEHMDETEFAVYPNPTSGAAQVMFSTLSDTRVIVELFDVTGNRVAILYEGDAHEGEDHVYDFDLGQYANGTYMIRLTTDNATITKRLVKTQ
jgi:transcriptional regulator